MTVCGGVCVAGIVLFALGIGEEVDQEELEGIGNKPKGNMSFVLKVDSFDALSLISTQLVAAACEVVAGRQWGSQAGSWGQRSLGADMGTEQLHGAVIILVH